MRIRGILQALLILALIVFGACSRPAETQVGVAPFLSAQQVPVPPETGEFFCKELEMPCPPDGRTRFSSKQYKAEQNRPEGNRSMSWQIYRVNTCDSTEMGYAIGKWKITLQLDGHDTTLFGKCMTVWKKQPDGSWKTIQEVNAMYPV